VNPLAVAEQLPFRPSRSVYGEQPREPRERDDDPSAVRKVDTQLIVRDLYAAGERATFRDGRTHPKPLDAQFRRLRSCVLLYAFLPQLRRDNLRSKSNCAKRRRSSSSSS
jgi:hypothetical protein